VALIKTDYEKGRLQPPPAGHPKGKLLSTGSSSSSVLIVLFSCPHGSTGVSAFVWHVPQCYNRQISPWPYRYKTDYEEGRLQATPAGHPKGELLSTGSSSSSVRIVLFSCPHGSTRVSAFVWHMPQCHIGKPLAL
jgi:hypothetical protein